MPHSSGPRFQDTIEVLRNRELCSARQPGYPVNVFRIVGVECQANFVWNMTRRFNYGDGFLRVSRDAVIPTSPLA
jgi:hypothetical protein